MNLILLLKYIIMGIIQGFTEPLPISSSGHIFIIKQALDTGILSDLNFEIIVNFGSLIAIMIIYWADIKEIIINFFKYLAKKEKKAYDDYKYAWLIVLGVIPVGAVGFFFKDELESILSNIYVVGCAFIITAIFLFLIRKMDGYKKDKDLSIKDAIVIGLIQAIAIVPGISRSGAALIGGMYRKLDKKAALKYSFMLYIPISFGTIILGIKDIILQGNLNEILLPYTLGFIASLIVTYFTTKWFMDLVKKGKLIYFSIYCLLVGLSILIFL